VRLAELHSAELRPTADKMSAGRQAESLCSCRGLDRGYNIAPRMITSAMLK